MKRNYSMNNITLSAEDHPTAIRVTAISLAVVATGIGWIVFSLIVYRCFRRKIESRKERARKEGIYFYLQRFEVDDVDLRRAPTGGWHGTYVNKLAHGINDADSKSSSSSEETYLIESSDDDDSYDDSGNGNENGDGIMFTSDIEKGGE